MKITYLLGPNENLDPEQLRALSLHAQKLIRPYPPGAEVVDGDGRVFVLLTNEGSVRRCSCCGSDVDALESPFPDFRVTGPAVIFPPSEPAPTHEPSCAHCGHSAAMHRLTHPGWNCNGSGCGCPGYMARGTGALCQVCGHTKSYHQHLGAEFKCSVPDCKCSGFCDETFIDRILDKVAVEFRCDTISTGQVFFKEGTDVVEVVQFVVRETEALLHQK